MELKVRRWSSPKVVSLSIHVTGADKLQHVPPKQLSQEETSALKNNLTIALNQLWDKTSTLSIQALKRLLLRASAALITSPKVSSLDDSGVLS